jgi:hypothetical protein
MKNGLIANAKLGVLGALGVTEGEEADLIVKMKYLDLNEK